MEAATAEYGEVVAWHELAGDPEIDWVCTCAEGFETREEHKVSGGELQRGGRVSPSLVRILVAPTYL